MKLLASTADEPGDVSCFADLLFSNLLLTDFPLDNSSRVVSIPCSVVEIPLKQLLQYETHETLILKDGFLEYFINVLYRCCSSKIRRRVVATNIQEVFRESSGSLETQSSGLGRHRVAAEAQWSTDHDRCWGPATMVTCQFATQETTISGIARTPGWTQKR